jgi:hypothetical protein
LVVDARPSVTDAVVGGEREEMGDRGDGFDGLGKRSNFFSL